MTVRDALGLPPLRRGLPDVVAGRAGLDRPVRWAHAAEVPHIAVLLKGGELLLTTGMGIGPAASEQQRLVADLAARGVAALVVELGETMPELPGAMVRAAETQGLPLVALRREIRFVEVTEAVHTALLDAEVGALRRSEKAQRAFTDILLAGGDVPGLLGALASAIGNPVVLEDAAGHLIGHARHRAGDEDVFSAWERTGAGHPEDSVVVALPPDGRGRLVALAVD
ncbi:MAG: PucR family transcriptional regulator ligand-binding domain-containing protein, partial [Actinomycetota bacterium]|nr:PucR family transcriptional regulator ligand-binding domain-containing protein [Actinomycetota bacterium]